MFRLPESKVDLSVNSLNSHQKVGFNFFGLLLNWLLDTRKKKTLKTLGLIEIEDFCVEKIKNSTWSNIVRRRVLGCEQE